MADERSTDAAREGWNGKQIRTLLYWAATFVVVFELAAGSLWNLFAIDWVEAQLHHLGYPHYFTYVLGVAQVGAAVVIVAPGLVLIKEWAYVGAFFLWSGAVVSHLTVGDGPGQWGVPLTFGIFAVASWALRPAERRLPGASPRRHGPRAWVGSLGLLIVLYAVSLLTLPAADEFMRERAVELGWIGER